MVVVISRMKLQAMVSSRAIFVLEKLIAVLSAPVYSCIYMRMIHEWDLVSMGWQLNWSYIETH